MYMTTHILETEIPIPFLYSAFHFLLCCSLLVLEGIFLFVPTYIFIHFNGSKKLLIRLDSSLPSFYLFFIYHWTCSRPNDIWNTARLVLSFNQAINHLIIDQNRINVVYHVTGITFPLFLNTLFLITTNNYNIISSCIVLLITLT
jgi:hypothetical protein